MGDNDVPSCADRRFWPGIEAVAARTVGGFTYPWRGLGPGGVWGSWGSVRRPCPNLTAETYSSSFQLSVPDCQVIDGMNLERNPAWQDPRVTKFRVTSRSFHHHNRTVSTLTTPRREQRYTRLCACLCGSEQFAKRLVVCASWRSWLPSR